MRLTGKPGARAAAGVWLAMNKPAGAVTSRRDPDQGQTVYDYLPEGLPVLEALGRLDRPTTGLLLFTNDHALGQRLLNPESELPRVYQVVTNHPLPAHAAAVLQQGLLLDDGILCKPVKLEIVSEPAPGRSYWFTLREGKHREVRRLVMHFKCKVRGLHRLRFGGVELGGLKPGQTRILEAWEIANLARWIQKDRRGDEKSKKVKKA